ncbi:MAG: hypothetical protein ACI9IJ_000846 [Psychromonas sp.]
MVTDGSLHTLVSSLFLYSKFMMGLFKLSAHSKCSDLKERLY